EFEHCYLVLSAPEERVSSFSHFSSSSSSSLLLLELGRRNKQTNKQAVCFEVQRKNIQTDQIPPLKSGEKMGDYADIKTSPKQEDEVESAPQMKVLSLEFSSGASCSKPIGEFLASSSQSSLKKYFIEMGFLSNHVDRVFEDHGEENFELLLEALIAYSADNKSSPESSDSLDEIFGCRDQIGSNAVGPELKDVKKSTPESSDSLDEIFGACKDEGNSAASCVNSEFEDLDAGSKVNEDKRASLLMMKFSAQEVDFALDKLGEDAPVNDLVEFIVAAQLAQSSGVDIHNQTHADDGKIEENTTKAMFWTMDVTLGLLEMGFSEDEISSAIEKFGAEIPIEELADSIFAHRMADTCFEKDEPPTLHRMNESHGESFRNSLKSPNEETETSSSKAFLHAEDSHTSGIPKGKKPKLEYDGYSDAFLGNYSPETKSFEPKSTGVSMSFPPKELHKMSNGSVDGVKIPQQLETNFSRSTRQIDASRPYIFYGNVLDVSHETWKKISQFLYAIAPEFVNTQFFSALSRKEGYIHNLPKDNRSHIFPRSPATIEDAMPHIKEWWPSWDTRKQLSCINHESQGISQMCERLGKMLKDSQGVLSVEQQTEILHGCKRLNLMWVGQYKLNPIEPEQVERILGYPVRHTHSIGYDRVERLKLLKHSFQIDTLGYHLSTLKSLFPNGLTILSLYSGIGGAEIAIHRLGLRLKGVVSVELSEANRRILRRWWENTEQRGELVQIEDIGKLTSTKLKSLIDDLGGFDLIICQNPYTPWSSKAALDSENPAGFEYTAFFEFVRVLQIVRSTMGCR
ncbi:hypothetical protein AQUCO_02900089v1, partial [Aquilegia coerulea]